MLFRLRDAWDVTQTCHGVSFPRVFSASWGITCVFYSRGAAMTRQKRNGFLLAERRIDHLLTIHSAERNVCRGSRPPGVCGRGRVEQLLPIASYKATSQRHHSYILVLRLSCRPPPHTMTLQTEKSVLTYSKSKGIVALVTGME